MNSSPPVVAGGLSPDAFTSLFASIGALRNRRALVAMIGCMVAGVLVAGVFSLLAARLGFFFGFLGGVALFVAGAAGINAAGVLLMDQARGLPSRPLGDAVVYGLMCIPKFILLSLALCAVALAVFIAIALAYVVCKLPVLGPLLFVVVFPLSVVVAGLTLSALFLCMFLALPAIWEGASITHAVAQALAIARNRLVESILLLAVVGLLAAVVGFIVFSVLFTGLMPAVGMSATILGGEGLGGVLGMMRPGGEFGDAGGAGAGAAYAIAAGVGAGLLWAIVGSLVALVSLLGLSIVYLRLTEGVDVGATEAALQSRFDEAKQKAAGFGQKAREAAERAREQARHATAAKPAAPVPDAPPAPREAPPDSTTPGVAKTLTCAQCLSAVGRDDAFCGVCGHRLK